MSEQTRTRVQVGRSWQRRYSVSGYRHHVVIPDGDDGWTALCSGQKATREYQGFLETAITCPTCAKAARDGAE